MRTRTICTVAFSLFLSCQVYSQSFLDHIQEDKGKGSVSVKQSDEISKLVNGSSKEKPESGKANEEKTRREESSRQESPRQESRSTSTVSRREADRGSSRADEERDKARRERERKYRETVRNQKLKEFEENTSASDSRKKVMSNSRRAKGYRIQVYAGGNTRADRAKAQEIGAKLKTQVVGQPIYVHFYSPRWCCRFGNFRNQEDANKMLKKIKKMGYNNACVIRAMITVNR